MAEEPADSPDSDSGSDEQSSPTKNPFDELLSSFDHLFKNRYTEKDDDFMATVNRDALPPPCVHPWYSKPRRNFDYSRSRRGRGDNRFHPYHRPRDSQHHQGQHDQHWQQRRQGGQKYSGGPRPRW